ncbi:MAG: DUF2723 domain-containing protein [Kiritimatiellales bacterium]
METKPFFRRADWFAFGLTFLITLIVYALTLAPTVTLEDSGELIVASDYLGVPHPPGYPIWSLLTWAFQWVFNGVKYHGYPNPAWGVNFFSAFAGAMACGVLAMLISSSGMQFIRGIKRENAILGEWTESLFSCVAGIAGGLLLAFSQGMWSQSVITEVYSLNILFQTAVLLFLYRWTVEPENPRPLFLMAFTFGLGLTNHQTLMFMGLAVALAIVLRHVRLARDFAIVGAFYVVMVGLNKVMAGDQQYVNWCWTSGPEHFGFWFWTVYAVVIPLLGLFLPNGRTVCATYLLMLLGLSFYLYMPISSDQNPPINWGYPRTWEGFMHAITRGQYERVVLVDVLNDPGDFILKAKAFFSDLKSQFLLPLVLTGFLPFACWQIRTPKRSVYMLIPTAVLVMIGSLLSLEDFLFPEPTPVFYSLMSLIALLLALVVISGISIISLNFVGKVYRDVKASDSSLMDWLAVAMVTLLGVGSALAFLFVDFRLLMSLTIHSYPPGIVMAILGIVFVPLAVVAAVVLLRRRQCQIDFDIRASEQHWVAITLVAFVGVGLVFVILQNPKLDLQTQFIARVQYIQSHAVYALWVGYGLLLLMAGFQSLVKNNIWTKWLGTTLVFLLPLILIYKNYTNDEQLKVVGGSEQNGHDFGWQFGNWQLRGVEGIKEDLWYYCGQDQAKFDEEWAKYPNPDYPEPMGTNAVFFGGTDPGRFVPTYMIYCPQVRPDVYLITQNALADNTYMAVMRDLYGDQIWIPSTQDSNTAFREYVQDIQSGKIAAGADVKMDGGRVQVQGVGGVMQINGILCKQIFDHNQYITEARTDESTRQSGAAVVPADPVGLDGRLREREFFVEESYVIPWMYPYLTPHGLIMKINNRPTEITPEMVKNDHDFWNWYVARLTGDSKFLRDIVARKTFSKLRTALAGLYAARGNPSEAEYAFKQAVELYPLSPEAVFRLADLYMRRQRFTDAKEVIQEFVNQDEHNDKAREFLDQISRMEQMVLRKTELEQKLKGGKGGDINEAFELVQIYNALQDNVQLMQMVDTLGRSNLPVEVQLQLAQMLVSIRRLDIAEPVLARYLQQKPDDLRSWLELASLRLTMNRISPALDAIANAVEKGGEPIRNVLRRDNRFQPLWNNPRFQQLVPPPSMRGLPFGGSSTGGLGGLTF